MVKIELSKNIKYNGEPREAGEVIKINNKELAFFKRNELAKKVIERTEDDNFDLAKLTVDEIEELVKEIDDLDQLKELFEEE